MKKLIHIGFPKCASTTLQENLFNLSSEILYIGVTLLQNGAYEDLSLKLINSIKNKDEEKIKNCIDEVNFIHSKYPDKILIFSNESMIYYLDAYIYNKYFKNYELILFIRSPVSFITSKYKQYLRGFGTKFTKLININEYINYLDEENLNEYVLFLNLQKNIIQKKIHIFQYEDIFKKNQKFFSKISLIFNIDKNKVLTLFEKFDSNPGLLHIDYLYFKIQTIPILSNLIVSKKLSVFRKIIKRLVPKKKKNFKLNKYEIYKINNMYYKDYTSILNSIDD